MLVRYHYQYNNDLELKTCQNVFWSRICVLSLLNILIVDEISTYTEYLSVEAVKWISSVDIINC